MINMAHTQLTRKNCKKINKTVRGELKVYTPKKSGKIRTDSEEFEHYKRYTMYLKNGQYELMTSALMESDFANNSDLARGWFEHIMKMQYTIILDTTRYCKADELERHSIFLYERDYQLIMQYSQADSFSQLMRSVINLMI